MVQNTGKLWLYPSANGTYSESTRDLAAGTEKKDRVLGSDGAAAPMFRGAPPNQPAQVCEGAKKEHWEGGSALHSHQPSAAVPRLSTSPAATGLTRQQCRTDIRCDSAVAKVQR